MLRGIVVACGILASCQAAAADEPAAGHYRYRIHHQIFGDIGHHEITVSRTGGAVVVEHAAELAVRILAITAYHRVSRYREVWRAGRLIAFDGLTVDNDEPFEVTARAVGDRLVVEGSAGRIGALAATVPSQPSLASAIERAWFFDIKTGALLHAEVHPAGRARLTLGGRPVETEKYEVAGELEQDVWYDDRGVWAQWRMWRQGAAITLVRE